MLFEEIAKIYFSSSSLSRFKKKLDSSKNITVGSIWSIRPFLISCYFVINPKPIIVIVPNLDVAKEFYKEFINYVGINNVMTYVHISDLNSSVYENGQKFKTLNSIKNKDKKIYITTCNDILKKIPEKDSIEPVKLTRGCKYNIETLVDNLVKFGYEQTQELTQEGSFTKLGDVLNIWPSNLKYIVKLDFLYDTLEEIVKITPATFHQIDRFNTIDIYPCDSLVFTKKNSLKLHNCLDKKSRLNKQIKQYLENFDLGVRFEHINLLEPYIHKLCQFWDYLDRDFLICQIEPKILNDNIKDYYETTKKTFKNYPVNYNQIYVEPSKINFENCQVLTFVSLMRSSLKCDINVNLIRPLQYRNTKEFYKVLRFYVKSNFYIFLNIQNYSMKDEVIQEIVKNGFSINNVTCNNNTTIQKKLVNICNIDIPLSFIIKDSNIVFINFSRSFNNKTNTFLHNNTDDLFRKSSKKTKVVDITKLTLPFKIGEFVVHNYHGIAKVLSLETCNISGDLHDYIVLEYDKGDKLYVPIEQLGRITKYSGLTKPRVTRLGCADWTNTLKKTSSAVSKMAFDLVDVYSRRMSAQGHAFGKHESEINELKKDFQFCETYDQTSAINDVFTDMESSKPMDRLICGDVGFGKTEVALRAAYKCVLDNFQVMFLCPTTILAEQHYKTFSMRLEKFNVKCEVLSRFKTDKEVRKILEEFSSGDVSILIGTHRLLSRDVNPYRLGLMIIDEEQRFGVTHKEQLKNYREWIDVLTLSATPIPRTMQMATSGIKDMSIIITPPINRKPVDVYVGIQEDNVIRDAIDRELKRSGQVYYICDKVKSINKFYEKLSKLSNNAKIGIVHGQMTKTQIENVMNNFNNKKIDILVSTTLLENGIDNPNTNTLIVENTQNFGLSQMYQLKGRIGRSSKKAYALFLFDDKTHLNKNAIERLKSISEFSDLGSGMKIALKDLEIRGAGNFFGDKQSGHVNNVGFELFSQMLKVAIENLQKNPIEVTRNKNKDKFNFNECFASTISDITINIPGSAYLTQEYIPEVDKKILWYRKFACATCLDDVYELESDLLNTFLNIDQISKNYIIKTRIAALLLEYGFNLLTVSKSKLNLYGMNIGAFQGKKIKEIKATYLKKSKCISINLNNIIGSSQKKDKENFNLTWQIFKFLESLTI